MFIWQVLRKSPSTGQPYNSGQPCSHQHSVEAHRIFTGNKALALDLWRCNLPSTLVLIAKSRGSMQALHTQSSTQGEPGIQESPSPTCSLSGRCVPSAARAALAPSQSPTGPKQPCSCLACVELQHFSNPCHRPDTQAHSHSRWVCTSTSNAQERSCRECFTGQVLRFNIKTVTLKWKAARARSPPHGLQSCATRGMHGGKTHFFSLLKEMRRPSSMCSPSSVCQLRKASLAASARCQPVNQHCSQAGYSQAASLHLLGTYCSVNLCHLR